MRFGLIFSLILAVIAVVFALQNPQVMDVNLLFAETEGSTALVLILTFGFGVLVGLMSTLPTQLRTRRKLRALEKEKASSRTSDPSVSSSSSSSKTRGSKGSSTASDQ